MDYKMLAARAKAAKRFSYSPHSGFRVGAAVLTAAGKVYTGCNIENSSYGLTVCAERTALFKAVSEGETSFAAIAIASDGKTFTPPCGACRQVMSEIAGDIDVILTAPRNGMKVMRMSDLLPLPFGSKNLSHVRRTKR